MTLARLRIFHEVARTGTFAAAAEALSYTPSAISQQIAKLEAEVGMVLLNRTPRGIALTEAGRVLLARTRSILAEVRAARTELDDLAGLRAGTLRLGSFPTATQTIVTRALQAFARRCPDVRVVLVDDEPHNTAARLHDRELDLGLVFATGGREPGTDYFGRVLCTPEAVEVTPLFEDRYVLVLPTGHRLAGDRATLESLRGEVLVGSPFAPGLDALAAACRAQGFEARFNGFVCTDYLAVRSLVAAGEGIAVVPGLAAVPPVAGTVARPLEDAPTREVLLARAAGGFLPPSAEVMEAVLQELGDVDRDLALAA